MRLISQNKNMDIPYELSALVCERHDNSCAVVAYFGAPRYIMGRYDSMDGAKLTLEAARAAHLCNEKTFVFPEQ